jgi:putative FmdB family regulatory protein
MALGVCLLPVYDYLCVECGPFSEMKPMSAFSDPCDCPVCGQASERAILRAPFVAGMDSKKRNSLAVNERSANEPRSSGTHGASCGCCRPLSRTKTATASDGSKSFPSARPWMISH